MVKKHIVIPVFVPHSGCPFDCIYCNQKNISGQMDQMTETQMISTIEEHLSTISENHSENENIEIAFYGGSFTGIEQATQKKFLEIANQYIQQNKVKEIRISTRPDYINEEILEYLGFYNVRTIELGVQSLDEEVLKVSCRGHRGEDVIKAAHLIKNNGFTLGIQTMIGLPGDNRDKDLYTANEVLKMKPSVVRIYPTLVIRDTYLEKMYTQGRFVPLKIDEAVEICAELLDIYTKNDIKVIRIGLQPTENISSGRDVVAGPFHPAFRQLVQSRLILNQIENHINDNGLQGKDEILIFTDSKNISCTIGQKRENIKILKEKYGFKSIKVIDGEPVSNQLFEIK